ncbi:hypothetical protein QWZ06_15920 [Chryseobacterium tructae]|uniref:Uncharacterized protein n=1 Tax=Chryseobacterium tructae TaxID=1037380 RepID=A0ABV7XY81_9FLAO|nr:hypothetical protein [Chryseobacterium tructae]MDN3693672.1 hypothetical protein [Chryseobacterium tructae]
MKANTKFLFSVLIVSFLMKQWVNSNLKDNLKNINTRNIEHLEFKTNKNFTGFGIENIGNDLRDQLLKMDIDHAEVKVANGIPFYFFQESEIKITGKNKSLAIFVKYDWLHFVFKIRGYQIVKY